MTAPRAARRLALLAAACGATGCVGRRERLDVPQLSLEVTTPAPAAGGRVAGRVAASDASGVVSLAVFACTADSVFRATESFDRDRAVGFDFSLRVSSAAPDGTPVEVYAAAVDDQGFVAEAARVVYVGGSGGASGAGLCTRLRRSPSLALPTAPPS